MNAFVPLPSARHASPGLVVPATTPPPRCLVVDDDGHARRWIARQLGALGLEVVDCGGVRAADLLLQRELFPVVFLDCVLEDGDGFSIARSIRRHQPSGAARSWIVGLSASAGPAHEQACRAAGMDAVLCKPADPAALRRVLAGRVEQPAHAVAQVDVDRRVAAVLQAACAEDWALLKAAIDRTDSRRAGYHAHRLRGSALLAGMAAVASVAAAVEEAACREQWTTVVSMAEKIAAILNLREF